MVFTSCYSLGFYFAIVMFLTAWLTFSGADSFAARAEISSQESAACVAASQQVTARQSHEPIVPLPQSIDLDFRKVALGRKLFHDKRFSRDNTTSCASCHNVGTNGSDTGRYSTGWEGGATAVNTPTVFNSGFNFVQFWDGRAATLEEQVGDPIHNPVEMGSNWQTVLQKLGSDSDIKDQFSKIYSDGLTVKNIQDSVATFERSLITPNSRFDNYLRGDEAAITAEEKTGYSLFKSFGCAACHQGQNVGGNLYQRLGIFENYFKKSKSDKADQGRYNVTKDQRDYHVFKVPSLRNVELTAPYFHDGSVQSLGGAVQIMAYYQLGLSLSARDSSCIVAFLKTLTGQKNWVQP